MQRKHPAVVLASSEHNWALLLLAPSGDGRPGGETPPDPVFHCAHTHRASSRRRHACPALTPWLAD